MRRGERERRLWPRAVKARLILALSVIALGLGPAAAADATPVDVTLTDHPTYEFTAFYVDGGSNCLYSSGCTGALAITHGKRQLDSTKLGSVYEYSSSYGNSRGDAQYDWTCKETGTLGWHLTLTRKDDPNTTDDESALPPMQKTGTFRIGRCTPWRSSRVWKGHAAAWAADGYYPEYVSRSRCSARKNPSTSWTCDVTHNNSYRECTDRYHVKFKSRLHFGRREEDAKYSVKKIHCRYF